MADRTTELDRPAPADLSRRTMIRCAALCGLAAPVLAACGSGDDSPGAEDASRSASSSSPSESPSSSEPGQGEDTERQAAAGLVATSNVPVGGGVILTDAGVVVTQPRKGEFKGFSDKCTHQGATLSSVDNGVITCPRHGSQFAIDDGSNVTGPNGSAGGSVPALPAVAVKVVGNQVVRV